MKLNIEIKDLEGGSEHGTKRNECIPYREDK